jgi:hypothetical protein
MTRKMTRKAFLQTLAAAAAASAYVPAFTACSTAPKSKMRLGVSLYSYGGDFLRSMSLEECIADAADMGAEGIEILSETHVPDYPNPSDRWVDQWHGLMDKYKTKPACFSTWVDSLLRKDRSLTVEESLDFLLRDLKLANRLGFKVMRPKLGSVTDDGMVAPEALQAMEKALPHAEELDVRIAPEVHSPTAIKSKTVDAYMEIVTKTNTKHFGLVWDMSIFTKRPPRAFMKMMLPGAEIHENVADYVEKAYMDRVPVEKVMAEVSGMGGGEADKQYAGLAYAMSIMENPRDLIPYLPHTYHFHGKFWQMTDDLHEYSIPYEEVLPVLMQAGWDGYMCSEYEGPRDLLLASDQLRRQHAMMRQVMNPT